MFVRMFHLIAEHQAVKASFEERMAKPSSKEVDLITERFAGLKHLPDAQRRYRPRCLMEKLAFNN